MHRTLVDLAEALPEHGLAKVVHESEVRRLFDLNLLIAAQSRVFGRSGRHRLRRVCADYAAAPVTRSVAEARFHELLSEAGIPAPMANATRAGHELDCLWPEARLNVEIDGAVTHKTTKAFYADRRRDRALRREGIAVIRVTWDDLTTGRAELERDLKEILSCR